jgi:hypothetical protein
MAMKIEGEGYQVNFCFKLLNLYFEIKDLGSNLMFANLSQYVCIMVELAQIKQLYSWKHILLSSWNLIRNQLILHS